MTRRILLLLGLACVAAVGVAVVWPTPAPVVTPALAVSAQPEGVGALGRVEPASRVRKLGQPGGFSVNRVERLLVAEGDLVSAGQLLAELSDASHKDAAVAQAEAALSEARAAADKVRAAGRPSEIAAQRARIIALRAVEDMNRRDAERSEQLVSTGAGARAAAERNRAAAARATAERAEAEAHLETLASPRPEDVAVTDAQVRSAESTLARVRAEAALSRIRAPIGGTVLKIHAWPGDLISTDGLLDLADLDRLDVVADVYETDLPRVRAGSTASVTVPGDPGRYAATVHEIGWVVRRTTQAGVDPVAAVDARTVEVRLALGDEGRAVLRQRINMQVQVSIRP